MVLVKGGSVLHGHSAGVNNFTYTFGSRRGARPLHAGVWYFNNQYLLDRG
jgi:hypothetical protein